MHGVADRPNVDHGVQFTAHPKGNGENGPTGRILIIDDDQKIRKAVGRVLKNLGHDVFEATDGMGDLQGLVDRKGPALQARLEVVQILAAGRPGDSRDPSPCGSPTSRGPSATPRGR